MVLTLLSHFTFIVSLTDKSQRYKLFTKEQSRFDEHYKGCFVHCQCGYIFVTKMSWIEESKGLLKFSRQAATCPPHRVMTLHFHRIYSLTKKRAKQESYKYLFSNLVRRNLESNPCQSFHQQADLESNLCRPFH